MLGQNDRKEDQWWPGVEERRKGRMTRWSEASASMVMSTYHFDKHLSRAIELYVTQREP